jgi:hypothetical protein
MEYEFTLIGSKPILFHADDVSGADQLSAWRKAAENKSVSVAGDDRSPPFTWQTYLYHDKTNLAIPQENILACLCKAGAAVPMAKGKGTFKSLSQSGLFIADEFCEFRVRGKPISIADVHAFHDRPFAEHVAAVRKLGFELSVKRATVGNSKHVRVRAKFTGWTIHGVIETLDPLIDDNILREMFTIAGKKVGLLDWRPSAPKKPGPYGTFRPELKPLAAKKVG